MKTNRNLLPTLLTTGALLTAAAGISVVAAGEAATPPQDAPAPHEWHHHGGPWRLLNKLNLTAAQRQQIKDIMTAAHTEMQSLHEQMRANLLKLRQTQPNDPNYANVVSQVSQTQGSLAARMVTRRADVRAQVFKVLTPAQQAELATLEAEMPSHEHGAHEGPGDE